MSSGDALDIRVARGLGVRKLLHKAEDATDRNSALCSALHKADYVDCLIMWSCHSELSREPCTVRLFISNWLYEVIIISEV